MCILICIVGFVCIILATLNLPGPGRYESDREFEDNSNPAYSIGLPRPQKPSETFANTPTHVTYACHVMLNEHLLMET